VQRRDIAILDGRAPYGLVKLLARTPVSSKARIEWLSGRVNAPEY
jgi:hypothetical protein